MICSRVAASVLVTMATFFARLPEGVPNLDLIAYGWPEPDILSMITDTGMGIGNYHDEEFRTLVAEARTTSDLGERSRLYFEAMKKMLADAAMIPLWTGLGVVAVRSEVKNFKLGPQGIFVYEDAYVES